MAVGVNAFTNSISNAGEPKSLRIGIHQGTTWALPTVVWPPLPGGLFGGRRVGFPLTPLPGFPPRHRIPLGNLGRLGCGFVRVSAQKERRPEVILDEIASGRYIVWVQLDRSFQVRFDFAGYKESRPSLLLRLPSICASQPVMVVRIPLSRWTAFSSHAIAWS